jgi:hypothetical protein
MVIMIMGWIIRIVDGSRMLVQLVAAAAVVEKQQEEVTRRMALVVAPITIPAEAAVIRFLDAAVVEVVVEVTLELTYDKFVFELSFYIY